MTLHFLLDYEDPDPYPKRVAVFPRSRHTDPESSHEAARGLQASGAHDSQMNRVEMALQAIRMGTGSEIGTQAGLPAYIVRKRLPDLERAGRVRRLDGVFWKTPRKEQVWVPKK